MKKILGSLLLIFVLVSFTSCKRGEKVIVDNPSDEIATTLNLVEVKNGNALNTDKDTSSAYYDVRVNKDIASSLFYQVQDVNMYIEDKTKSFDLKPLAFNATFAVSTNTTLAELIDILNSDKYGIDKADLGVDLLDDDNSDYLVGKLTTKNSVSIPEGLVANSEDKVNLVVVYLPIYGIYYYNKDQYVNVFLMVPVYYAFANQSTVSNYTGTIKECNFQLTEIAQGIFVLPSKSE